MRRAGPSTLARLLTGLSLVIIIAFGLLCFLQGPALAAGSLAVSVDRGLSLTTESEVLIVRAPSGVVPFQAAGALPRSSPPQILIHLKGPAGTAELHATDQLHSAAATLTHAVFASRDLASDGSLNSRAVIPSYVLRAPGAYLAHVELVMGTTVVAAGSVWLGKVSPLHKGVDLALVWPLTLGIHRDADGIFFDTTLEESLGSSADSGAVVGLTDLARKFPDWHFTLAIEPILLSQLRDMSDGYVRLDSTGSKQEIGADQAPAKDAAAAITALTGFSASTKSEIVVMPYAGPSMEALADNGWSDGVAQVQLGRRVAQEALALPGALPGVYAPDLDLATGDIQSYAQASVDHVVVSSRVANDLAEPVAPGTVTTRVRDRNNQRVTLVLADDAMQTVMSPPWDTGLFYAGLAAALSAGATDALVLSPAPGSPPPPAAYLQAIGATLQRTEWIRTLTLTDFIRVHPPDSRPILLDRTASASSSYIADELRASIGEAHQAVQDLVGATASGQPAIDQAELLLLTAESRWWSLPQTSPEVASIGLLYAERAKALAEAEFTKIKIGGLHSTTINANEGSVELIIDNGTTYAVKVGIELAPEGLGLPGGASFTAAVQPGRTVLPIRVHETGGTPRLRATLVIGSHTLSVISAAIQFRSIITLWPWIVGGAALVIAIVLAAMLLWRSARRRGRRKIRSELTERN